MPLIADCHAVELVVPYDGLTRTVYHVRHEQGRAYSLVHPNGLAFAFGRDELQEMLAAGHLRRWEGRPARLRDAEMIALRSASPLRPPAGRAADVDGLALFDHARQPSLFQAA